jgi:hypothetical protein
LKRHTADHAFVEVGLHFDNQACWPVPFDVEGFVEWREFSRVESNIDDRAADRDDLSLWL